jgi:chondroitin AC lyase
MSNARLAALEIVRLRLCDETFRPEEKTASSVRPDAAALAAALQPDGSWADVDYTNDSLKDWTTVLHLGRLCILAQAWHQPGTPSYRQETILRAALLGLDGWYARNPKNPNWWWNQIGAPLRLGEALLRLKGACDPSYIERAVPAFRAHEPIVNFTGQNLVWTATVMMHHGILTDDPGRVSQALTLIARELRVLPDEEGIQPDMSFHQHGKLLYSGGYGQCFAADVGRLLALAAGTAYTFPPPLVSLFARFLLDGSRWMVRGRTFDPVATGREISRQGHSADRFFEGLRHLAAFEHPRQEEARLSTAVDSSAGGSLVSGNRCFWNSDLMVQHRPAYYISIRTPSPRVLNADGAYCGGEGRLCHHMADGVTLLMRDGDEYRDLYPVWDWRQIPGTTAVQTPGVLNPDILRLKGERAFAGGASDGMVGCAAVDFSRAGLVAKKAWFLFDGELVALGAGIACQAQDPVRTTLNQCHWRGPAFMAGIASPLAPGVYPLSGGSAFWHDGIAYRILAGAGALRLGTQTGAWSDCGVGSPDPLNLPVLNAGLDHGVGPAGAVYAYAVQPGIEKAAAFAAHPARLVIVRNDPALQAVWHAAEGRGHAVFYEPGSMTFPDGQQIGADLPCILLYHPHAERGLTITLAQPEQREGLITLHLQGRITGTLGVSLPVRDQAGSSVTLVWQFS